MFLVFISGIFPNPAGDDIDLESRRLRPHSDRLRVVLSRRTVARGVFR